MRIIILIILLNLSVLSIAQEQKPVISVLGMTHLHNPGADAVNMDMGNIHSDKRQAELKEVISLISRFKPTKIAIEIDRADTLWSETYYNDFVNNTLEKTIHEDDRSFMSSETVQVCYPLAQMMNHNKLYGIDASANFDTDAVIAYAEKHNQTEELKEFENLIQTMQSDVEAIAKGSILEIIQFANSENFDKNYNQRFYLKHLIGFGKDGHYVGTQAVSEWYLRNLKIFTNLHRIVEPEDRVLVIYGAGHKDILVDLIKDRIDWEYYDINQVLNVSK
ncbi:DUF5694 domain-containing protein [Aquimarina algiphila]|uniref:TraB/GumN family protein n=1 Tax=Aquimarina algiphila TaxID=2047982 RepID=A0A554VRD9_9FLAO|nr:DUF5694 domain-containing protein [Aquimarina algiphila]TSE11201.1 hypothetical protein FOF46_00830 [Aquimarina algiphila]